MPDNDPDRAAATDAATAAAAAGAFSQATGRGLEDTSGENQRRYRAFQLELIG
ncbi:MAG: hypothetical protein QOK15_819, partial [Nocardioidaceae bacterium]|nr:hypothetical protein [Nocardioidaceae bacterium]